MPRKMNTAPAEDWPEIPDSGKTKGANGGRMSSARLSVIERRLQVFKLRLNGMSFAEIAEQMGMSVSGVWKSCRAAMLDAQAAGREELADLVELEIARLDSLQSAHWEKATSICDAASSAVVLKCISERCRLRGLYPATKLESKTTTARDPNDTSFPIDRLGLSLEVRKAILEGMRRAGAKSVDLSTMKPIK